MSLIELTLDGKIDKVEKAIKIIKNFAPYENGMSDEGYYVGYSGGKDSDCIRILCELAGVKHDLWHNHTTVDAPETVYYVRSIPNINISYPELTMWQLIVKKGMPPTRLARYCCAELKERGGQCRVCMFGVRKDESVARAKNGGLVKLIGKDKDTRKKAEETNANYNVNSFGGIVLNDDNAESRRMVEQCFRTRKTMVNPIIDWTTEEVWEFLHHYGCKSNPLYQCGKNRIGCIGCPMNSTREQDLEERPKYKSAYIRAFQRMLEGKTNCSWKTGEDVYRWWLNGDKAKEEHFEGQLELEEIIKDEIEHPT